MKLPSRNSRTPYVFIPLLMLLVSALAADPAVPDDEFAAIDRYADAAPASISGNLDKLAAYLVKPAKNDREKARAIFRWITQNIKYDVASLADYMKNKSIDPHSVEPETVLKKRIAVCSGYSSIFQALAAKAGLKVDTVNGYAKIAMVMGADPNTPNHAWNVVMIDNQWLPVDSTWGSGGLGPEGFVQRFNDYYFLTPPETLIASHFPTDEKWQLIKKKVSKETFDNWPVVGDKYFTYGLQLQSRFYLANAIKDDFEIRLDVPEDIEVQWLATNPNLQNTDPSKYEITNDPDDKSKFRFTFKEDGIYVITLFAFKNTDDYGMVFMFYIKKGK